VVGCNNIRLKDPQKDPTERVALELRVVRDDGSGSVRGVSR